ncbi:MAG TPA: hypothetical protein VEH77_18080 [Roseiarcus sp.]|nr:hypothetical protein [Roseiarcus sp.]
MPTLIRTAVTGSALAALAASLSACAQPALPYLDERCLSVSELTDGTWRVNQPIMFGRRIRVESGATLLKGEVIDGVDLGAVLQRTCRDPSLNMAPAVAVF